MNTSLRLLAFAAASTFAHTSGYAQAKTTFGNDIMLPSSGTEVYSGAKMSVSYTGSIYVVRLMATSASAVPQTWQLLKSTDDGATWTNLTSANFLGTDQKYTSVDVLAVGNTPATHRIFVARTGVDSIGQLGSINFTSYDSLGANSVAQVLPSSSLVGGTSPRGFTSVALASDTREPSAASGAYAISVVAVKDGLAADSVVAWTRVASATSYSRASVYGSATAQIRNVSASVGSCESSTTTYPRLGIAWDEFSSATAAYGTSKLRILYADDATTPTNSGPFTISSAGVTRRPQVVLSNKTSGTGSSTIKAMVAYELFISATDIDVNARVDSIVNLSAAPTFSDNPTIGAEVLNEYIGSGCYDPASDHFLFTYHNAGTNGLTYARRPFSIGNSTAFTAVQTNYRDASSAISELMPDIDFNTARSQAAFVWMDNARVMFDAEYMITTSVANTPTVTGLNAFPNPANDVVNLTFGATTTDEAHYALSDLSGREIRSGSFAVKTGENKLTVPVHGLPTGVYLLTLKGSSTSIAVRVSVR